MKYNKYNADKGQPQQPPTERSSGFASTSHFKEGVYPLLPDILRKPTGLFDGRRVKDIVLFSMLHVLSACIPKVFGWYHGKRLQLKPYNFIALIILASANKSPLPYLSLNVIWVRNHSLNHSGVLITFGLLFCFPSFLIIVLRLFDCVFFHHIHYRLSGEICFSANFCSFRECSFFK